MLWVKAFHIFFVIAWFCGIFYLPRLFVYHAMVPAVDTLGHERLVTMERKLFRIIMTPAAVLTVFFGGWLWQGYGITGGWLHAKLFFVGCLIVFHIRCYFHMHDFAVQQNTKSHRYFRFFNEVPSLLLLIILILVVVKPF